MSELNDEQVRVGNNLADASNVANYEPTLTPYDEVLE